MTIPGTDDMAANNALPRLEPQYSPDGRYWWTGSQWVQVPPVPSQPSAATGDAVPVDDSQERPQDPLTSGSGPMPESAIAAPSSFAPQVQSSPVGTHLGDTRLAPAPTAAPGPGTPATSGLLDDLRVRIAIGSAAVLVLGILASAAGGDGGSSGQDDGRDIQQQCAEMVAAGKYRPDLVGRSVAMARCIDWETARMPGGTWDQMEEEYR